MPFDCKAAYLALLEENQRLKTELTALRRKFGVEPDVEHLPIEYEVTTVNKNSSAEEKIALFMSLFRGRDDVYARRWYSEKTEKSGYSPVCANEWQPGLCDRRRQKCAACPNRSLVGLDEKAFDAHLRGNHKNGGDVVGVYPMTEDEGCFFIAVDFDDANWMEDVTSFREICEEKRVPVYVERSRSGNGAHVWVFFEEKISAISARKLGSALLTHTMNRRHELTLASYDRLFPSQDTIPAGGFGNLIALPLQGLARKNGNSVFVDALFQPYADQWAYLSGIQKITAERVKQAIAELCTESELGLLTPVSEDMETKPWERKRPAPPLTTADFPKKVMIVYANMLYIEKEGIAQRALNSIKRLAAFKNPDFYRAQAMRLPTYGKPRIIDCSTEDARYIGIPRGCIDGLTDLFAETEVHYTIKKMTNEGQSIDIDFAGELREEQATATNTLAQYDTGVLSAATAFGKTVIAANIIASKKINTLVLVHTSALLGQWKKSLGQFLLFHEELPEQPKGRGRKKERSHIGQLGAGKNTLTGKVDIATMQSLIHGDEVSALVKNYGIVIVDECHHISAFSFEQVLKSTDAKYVYGLTATPTRQDGHHPIIFMQCGAIRYRVDAKTQTEKRGFAHYIVPKFTKFRVPIRNAEKSPGITEIYTALTENETRNNRLVQDVAQAVQTGRCPIVLSQRTAHVALLAAELSKLCENVIALTGGGSNREKRQMLEKLNAVPKNEPLIIVATGKYIGEGFDFPRLDTLFLAMPVSWKGTLQQYAGRLHRDYSGKSEVIIYDYVDVNVKMLENMYHKRVNGYAAIGYKVKFGDEHTGETGIIFDSKNYYASFLDDIGRTVNNLMIVSPYIRKSRVQKIFGLLSVAKLNEVEVTIITRPPDSYNSAEQTAAAALIQSLRALDCTVIENTEIHQKLAVFDNRIVWYGSINLLGFGGAEDSLIRFESQEIAEELLVAVAGE